MPRNNTIEIRMIWITITIGTLTLGVIGLRKAIDFYERNRQIEIIETKENLVEEENGNQLMQIQKMRFKGSKKIFELLQKAYNESEC